MELILNPIATLGEELGMFFVAPPPKYQDPIEVKRPFESSIAAFGPIFETDERKEPKYE
jgi:hypothetical protein